MKRSILVVLPLMLVFAFAISSSFATHEKMQTIEGTVICLIPDYEKGTVKPIIATEPCVGLPPHAHILMTKKGEIYYLQGLDEGLKKIESSSQRTNVKITGRVEQNSTRGWILYVE